MPVRAVLGLPHHRSLRLGNRMVRGSENRCIVPNALRQQDGEEFSCGCIIAASTIGVLWTARLEMGCISITRLSMYPRPAQDIGVSPSRVASGTSGAGSKSTVSGAGVQVPIKAKTTGLRSPCLHLVR